MFESLKHFLPNEEVILCVNEKFDNIPEEYDIKYYDDSKTYTERLVELLNQIEDDLFLFIHEDMFLIDYPQMNYLKRYKQLVEEDKADSIKLIPVGSFDNQCIFEPTLYKNSYSKFSIQPTIIKRNTLLNLVKDVKLNIWEFENHIMPNEHDYIARIGKEKKRGVHHYDSSIFPYIATAINKGKWNFTEYSNELIPILQECNIDKNVRGVI